MPDLCPNVALDSKCFTALIFITSGLLPVFSGACEALLFIHRRYMQSLKLWQLKENLWQAKQKTMHTIVPQMVCQKL
jgi:hypothetical protein